MASDAIRLELMKNAFAAIADEMAATVIRTARSSVIKEAMDFSTGLLDPQGNLVAQGLCLPVHMGSFPPTLSAVLEKFSGDIHPGDVFALNDPYLGNGLHLPDIFVFKPIFFDGDGAQLKGQLVTVRVDEVRAYSLFGTRVG